MRFIDEVSIVVESGKGGDGCASFLRDRHTAFGGQNGMTVVVVECDMTATTRYNTLSGLRTRPQWRADGGQWVDHGVVQGPRCFVRNYRTGGNTHFN